MRLAMLLQSPQALFHYDTVWEEFLESAVAGWKEEAARQKAGIDSLTVIDVAGTMEKLEELIKARSGGSVIFAGDGINDVCVISG